LSNRKAYTCIELMMVVMVVAIVIAVALSTEDNVGKEKARLAAERFESDVAYARRASIARPDDPVVIRLDQVNNRYWLAAASSPETPLEHPFSGEPYIVNLGTGPSGEPQDVHLVAADFGGDAILGFNATGSTDQATQAVLQLTAKGAEYEVIVSPAGGKSTVGSKFTQVLVEPADPPDLGPTEPVEPVGGGGGHGGGVQQIN
jgi:type II secretory pathway pseudopilin PulG